jgi:hypothetical protein
MNTTRKTSVGPEQHSQQLTPAEQPKLNGEDAAPAAPAPLSDLFIAATELPNIDGRTSVLTELPKDLFMADRQDFAVPQKSKPGSIEFRAPKTWAMVHPDLERYRVMLCLKDKLGRKIFPITQALVREYPKLQVASRPFIVRQAIELDGPWFLWPAPWPGGKEFLGDSMHLEAQNAAREDWVQMTWLGQDWDVSGTVTLHAYDLPDWSKAEDFEAFLARGLGPLVLTHATQNLFIRRTLGM